MADEALREKLGFILTDYKEDILNRDVLQLPENHKEGFINLILAAIEEAGYICVGEETVKAVMGDEMEGINCNHCFYSTEDDLCSKGRVERQPGKAGYAKECPYFWQETIFPSCHEEGVVVPLKTREKEWQELLDFCVGKTIKEIERWEAFGPTFVFTDGTSLELYSLGEGFGWVLEEETVETIDLSCYKKDDNIFPPCAEVVRPDKDFIAMPQEARGKWGQGFYEEAETIMDGSKLARQMAEIPRLTDDEIQMALAKAWGIDPKELPRKRIPGRQIIAQAQLRADAEWMLSQGLVGLPSEEELGWQVILAMEEYNELGKNCELGFSLAEHITQWILFWLKERG